MNEPTTTLYGVPVLEPTGIRASLLNLLNQCKRKFFFAHHLGLRRKTALLSEALTTGTFFHAFMEHGPSPEGQEAVNKLYQEEVDKANQAIQERGDPFGILEGNITTLFKALEKARLMASMIWRYYPEPAGTKTLLKEAELSANVLTNEFSILLEGRVDRVVEFSNGERFLVDYKTTSYDPMNLLQSYPFSNACRIYRSLAEYRLSQAPAVDPQAPRLSGFQLTIIRKPGIKFCPNSKDANKEGKFGSCWEAYIDRCRQWYRDNDLQPVVQGTLRFTEPLHTDEFLITILRARPYFRLDKGDFHDYYFPRCSKACISPWGKPCDFLELCKSNPALWESKIKELYVQEPRKVESETIEGDPE